MRRATLVMLAVVLTAEWGFAQFVESAHGNSMGPALTPRTGALPELPSLQSWGRLKSLRAGKRVRVVNTDFEKLKGRVVRVTEDALTLRLEKDGRKQEVTLPRSDVVMVSIRPSKAKNVMLGMLFGALVGAGAARDSGGPDDCCWCDDDRRRPSGKEVAIGAAAGAAIVGIIAGLVSSDDVPIYYHGPRVALEPVESSPSPATRGYLQMVGPQPLLDSGPVLNSGADFAPVRPPKRSTYVPVD